jgi:tRNA(Ile)-lysidine synthase
VPMLLERVKEFIKKNSLLTENETVVVAVSGGPDSLCLLHMLNLLSCGYKLKLVVAHLNHCLRPEAKAEEYAVGKIAAALSLPFETRAVDIQKRKKDLRLSEEETGRLERYRFLVEVADKYGAARIALGHHLDDQAETVLLNVIRGTGVDGLAGIMAKSKRGRILLIRPLLTLRRSEIEAYCREHNLQPFTDSSNLKTDYTRNKVRLELIPHLEKMYNPRIREALFGLASLAADDRIFLRKLAWIYYKKLTTFENGETCIEREELLNLPPALSSRVLKLALQEYIPAGKINRLQITRLLSFAESGKTNKKLTLPGKTEISCLGNRLVLKRSSLTEGKIKECNIIEKRELRVPGDTILAGGRVITARVMDKEELSWPPPSYRAYLDYDLISDKPLHVVSRWPGARFHPQGAPGSKKLKDFLIDQKIPRQARESLPLVVAGREIVWVTGVRIADPCRVTGQTEKVLSLEYRTRLRRNHKGNVFTK